MPIPPAGPTGPANVHQRIVAASASVEAAPETVDSAAHNQADRDRSWIARRIIVMFMSVVGAVLAILVLQGWMTGDWSDVGSRAADVLKSNVLPIVTLVLGFYFGQSSKTT